MERAFSVYRSCKRNLSDVDTETFSEYVRKLRVLGYNSATSVALENAPHSWITLENTESSLSFIRFIKSSIVEKYFRYSYMKKLKLNYLCVSRNKRQWREGVYKNIFMYFPSLFIGNSISTHGSVFAWIFFHNPATFALHFCPQKYFFRGFMDMNDKIFP